MSALTLCSKTLFDERVVDQENELRRWKEFIAWDKFICPHFELTTDPRPYGMGKGQMDSPPLQRALELINFEIVRCPCKNCTWKSGIFFPNDREFFVNYDLDMTCFGDGESVRSALEYVFPNIEHDEDGSMEIRDCKLAELVSHLSVINGLPKATFQVCCGDQSQSTILGRMHDWLSQMKCKPYASQMKFFRFIHHIYSLTHLTLDAKYVNAEHAIANLVFTDIKTGQNWLGGEESFEDWFCVENVGSLIP